MKRIIHSSAAETMRYFKRYWDEPRGDAHDAWGYSWWYFEVDPDGVVTRQVEVYDSGQTLRYSIARPTGPHGMLCDQPLDLAEFVGYEVSAADFERVWSAGTSSFDPSGTIKKPIARNWK